MRFLMYLVAATLMAAVAAFNINALPSELPSIWGLVTGKMEMTESGFLPLLTVVAFGFGVATLAFLIVSKGDTQIVERVIEKVREVEVEAPPKATPGPSIWHHLLNRFKK